MSYTKWVTHNDKCYEWDERAIGIKIIRERDRQIIKLCGQGSPHGKADNKH